jgi:HIP---CoA ligase
MATSDRADVNPWRFVPADRRHRYDIELVNIPNAMLCAAKRYGDDEAVIDGATRLSFAALSDAMLDAVRAVQRLGVGRGDRVALWAPNSLRWIVAALGILGAGAVLVPINTRFRGDEAAHVLRKSGARALLTVSDFLDNDYLGMLRAADPAAPALRRAVLLSGEGPAISWDEAVVTGHQISIDAALAAIGATGPDDLSDIMFTSGTTGRPKGVMLTHGQSLRAHGQLTKIMGFRRGDRYLIVPPFFHTFGYKAGWLACLIHGVTIIPISVFEAETAMRTIAAERVSILCGPPTLFTDILDSNHRAEYDLSSLRLTMPAAAHSPVSLIRRIREEFTVDVTHSCYGLTEATSVASTTLPGIDALEDILGTVGRAVPDVELKVVDSGGATLAAGVPGEVWVRGYNVMRGYWDDPAATAEAITSDGWLRTGDIGTLDKRGYLRITDRQKDMIVTGGFNVYPAEVERVLLTHPGVREAAVVGADDRRLGEVPVAFVVTDIVTGQVEAELGPWVRARMANFKAPRRVVACESLPRNASGKVLKDRLREVASQLPPRP